MNQQRTISFLCHDCGQTVVVTEDLFALSAQPKEIPCPCAKSMLRIEFLPETVTMEIPCHICKKNHCVTCPSTAFVAQKLLTFSCSGIDCCFVGEEEAVFQATPRMEKEADLWAKLGDEKGTMLNQVVMEEVLLELKEIAERGGISCVCGSKRWGFQLGYTTIEIGCPDCGRVTRVPASIVEDIDNICCCYKIKIGATK